MNVGLCMRVYGDSPGKVGLGEQTVCAGSARTNRLEMVILGPVLRQAGCEGTKVLGRGQDHQAKINLVG